MKKLLITFTVVTAFSVPPVLSQQGTVTNTERQVAQHARIAEGIKSGELTGREARMLRREQKKIQIEKKIAQADGKVTPREKAFLRREQNRASRHIARQKHDRQSR